MSNEYLERNALLKELGYLSYQAYLASSLWYSIRARAYQFHGSSCRLCGARAEVIHHRGYGRAVMLGKSLNQLVPLCHACHQEVEYYKGRKRSFAKAHAQYNRLWARVK